MNLGVRAKVTVAVVLGMGLALLGVVVAGSDARTVPSGHELLEVLVVVALVIATWLRPLIIYRRGASEAVHLDEGCLVLLLLVAGPRAAVIAFAVATVVAQALMRRPLVKSAFNVGLVCLSAGAGAAVFSVLSMGAPPASAQGLGAAAAAAAAYFVTNSVAMAAILSATGSSWHEALHDGMDIRLLLLGGSVVTSFVTALVLVAYPWAVAVAVLPILILRQVLAGHFEARHDRERMNGLFEATLEVNRAMGREHVESTLLDAARTLLRCDEATIHQLSTSPDGLSTPLAIPDHDAWLTVAGRSRTEPFDRSDRALLDALAAVGAVALANAALYQEGRQQKERLAAITANLGEGVCAVDREGKITYLNPAASSMLGWDVLTELDAHALHPGLESGPSAPDFLLAPATRAMASGESVTSYDSRFDRRDGSSIDVAFTVSPIAGEDGPDGAVLAFSDITERKEFERQLARNAFHDALTGLPNRRLFLDRLEHALARSERSGETHAVLFCDIDRFKLINDSLGHHSGDALLISMAERISTTLRPGDVVARMGGDEFAVLLEGISCVDDAVATAHRVRAALVDPFSLPDGHDVVANLSMGIALTEHGVGRDDVLHDADVAMYRAKARHGGTQYEVFDGHAMGTRSSERIELESELRAAIERGELEVYYQPLVSIPSQRLLGAEALIRWNHPRRGLLAPGHFIELAEETGLILPIGELVLADACEQVVRWREEHGVSLKVSVNLSARQFQHQGLADLVAAELLRTRAEPSQLCLEVTESLAMEDLGRTTLILNQLKALGVQVAIDDFGTGHSALGYLASFPIDVVKVDRSFVDGVDVDPVKSAIVLAVLHLSRAIGATTVVEGIETTSQLAHLETLGCAVAQGFLFARPGPASGIDHLLDAGGVVACESVLAR